jgi:16S rRNA (cytidine1402-2'-O)-methyltransferase
MMSALFLVSTPIGNLQDITLRAIETLKTVDLILAEDTRHTKILLSQFNITTPMLSYEEYNEHSRIPYVIQKLKDGINIALVSDAGTPLISDPGYKLVREVISQNIQVEAIPGPSSILTALVLSGLPTDKFCFLGFFPRKTGQQIDLLKNLKDHEISMTYIFFESPFRLIKTLKVLEGEFGEIEVVVCRELTKIHQEIIKDSTSKLLSSYAKRSVKGEIVLLFHL